MLMLKKMILEFLQYDEGNLKVLSDYLEKNGILYEFFYGNLFPKCFSRINDYGVRTKTLFNTYYQNFIIPKNVINWQNNHNNLTIKEEVVEQEKQTEKYDNASPLNMTTLEDKPKITKNKKRKINNAETKFQKRELKKQKLLQQLNENTEKLKKLKKKIN